MKWSLEEGTGRCVDFAVRSEGRLSCFENTSGHQLRYIDIELGGQFFQVHKFNSGGEMLDFLKFICQRMGLWITESLLPHYGVHPIILLSSPACKCCTRWAATKAFCCWGLEAWPSANLVWPGIPGPSLHIFALFAPDWPGASGAFARQKLKWFTLAQRGGVSESRGKNFNYHSAK